MLFLYGTFRKKQWQLGISQNGSKLPSRSHQKLTSIAKIKSIIIGRIHIHLSDLTDDNTFIGLITQPPTETAGDLC